MPDEIFGERFFGHKMPAWHRKGIVLDENKSAQEAYELMGAYTVRLRPLFTPEQVPVPAFAIMRDPTHDDRVIRCFGVVSPQYQLITPEAMTMLYDDVVGLPVDTMGALRRGEVFFFSTRLPDYDVKGDPVENYLLVFNYMNAQGAARIKVTPVRVVCQNTLSCAVRSEGECYRVIHRGDAIKQLAHWLETIWTQANETSAVLKQAFDILAGKDVGSQREVDKVLEQVYPDPKDGESNAPARTRNHIMHLFNGFAAGADMHAFRGTAWGLYNSIAEYEDRHHKPGANFAESVLIGERARIKAKAFEVLHQFALS
jgi:phage/plasmid-like protein (TIGR03299 family)